MVRHKRIRFPSYLNARMKRGIDFLGDARKQYAIDRIALIRRTRHAALNRERFVGMRVVKYENTAFHAATQKIEKRHCSPPRLISAMPNAAVQRRAACGASAIMVGWASRPQREEATLSCELV